MKKPTSPEIGSTESVSILPEIKTFFTSVKTTIFLLFAIAVGSILGTIIPQGEALDRIAISGNPFLYRLALILDLNNIFRSWWFTTLLGLITLNLLGCLFRRIPVIMEDWNGKNQKSLFKLRFISSRGISELKDSIASIGKSVMRVAPRVTETSDKATFSWDKHKIYLLGFPLIHIGIIVILLGSLVGAFWGYKGHALIKEGDATDKFSLISTGTTRTLPFKIMVDAFTLTTYPTGEPKEFRSNVRLLQDGKEVAVGSILVNHPLTFEGISLFQSDYRVLGVKNIRLSFKTKDGQNSENVFDPNLEIDIPASNSKIKTRSLDPGSMAKGSGIQISVPGTTDQPSLFSIYQKDAQPLNVDGVEIRFLGFTPLYATGLQIGYDPGVYIVWLGCSMLVLGFALTLFTNLRRLSIELTASEKGTQVIASGRSRKLRREFREAVKSRLAENVDLSQQN
jgi:cytochrome c biogenesis protein